MASDAIEGPEERLAQVLRAFEETVVRRPLAGVVPDPFAGIEFRPIAWQLKHFDIASVLGEPSKGLLLLVVGRVVLDQVHPVSAAVERRCPFGKPA